MKQDVLNYIQLDKMTRENFNEIEIMKDNLKKINKVLEAIKNE